MYPVAVRSGIIKGLCGDAALCYDGEEPIRFLIRINKKKNFEIRVDTLMHEWSHCLTWLGAGQDEDHSSEFGIAYARIYSKSLEWNFGRKKRS